MDGNAQDRLASFERMARLAGREKAPALDVSDRVFATIARRAPRLSLANRPLWIMSGLSVAAALIVLIMAILATGPAGDPWNDFVEPMTMVMR